MEKRDRLWIATRKVEDQEYGLLRDGQTKTDRGQIKVIIFLEISLEVHTERHGP